MKDWSRVMYSNESTCCCLRATRKRVRRPAGSDVLDSWYTVKTTQPAWWCGHPLLEPVDIRDLFPSTKCDSEQRALSESAQVPPPSLHGDSLQHAFSARWGLLPDIGSKTSSRTSLSKSLIGRQFAGPEPNREWLELFEKQTQKPGHLLCPEVEGGYPEDVDPGHLHWVPEQPQQLYAQEVGGCHQETQRHDEILVFFVRKLKCKQFFLVEAFLCMKFTFFSWSF